MYVTDLLQLASGSPFIYILKKLLGSGLLLRGEVGADVLSAVLGHPLPPPLALLTSILTPGTRALSTVCQHTGRCPVYVSRPTGGGHLVLVPLINTHQAGALRSSVLYRPLSVTVWADPASLLQL